MVERYKEEIVSIIRKHLPSSKIYLFGSRARKTHREGADIDLAIDAGAPVDMNDILTIKDEIEETTLPVFVDMVDMNAISDDLKEEIVRDGVLWAD